MKLSTALQIIGNLSFPNSCTLGMEVYASPRGVGVEWKLTYFFGESIAFTLRDTTLDGLMGQYLNESNPVVEADRAVDLAVNA